MTALLAVEELSLGFSTEAGFASVRGIIRKYQTLDDPAANLLARNALVKALDQLDAVIELIRRSQTTEEANTGLQDLLDIDEMQARAILDMQEQQGLGVAPEATNRQMRRRLEKAQKNAKRR